MMKYGKLSKIQSNQNEEFLSCHNDNFPTMISEYRTKLISKEILRKNLDELYEAMDQSQNSQQC